MEDPTTTTEFSEFVDSIADLASEMRLDPSEARTSHTSALLGEPAVKTD